MPKLFMPLILLVIIFTACSNESLNESASNTNDAGRLQIKTTAVIDRAEEDHLKKLIHEFLTVCQPLKEKYLHDIEYIEYVGRYTCEDSHYDYRCENLNWASRVYLRLKIKDDTKSIPSNLIAWGHTEHIYLGGPKNPGLTISKFPQLCNSSLPDSHGKDTFISIPELSKLF